MKNTINTIKNALHPEQINFNKAATISAAIIALFGISLAFEIIPLLIPAAVAATACGVYHVYYTVYVIKEYIKNDKEN